MILSLNSPATAPTTRFAPSPTGLLHLGHVFSALSCWSAARAQHGTFLLRIEDIDAQRCRPEFGEAILHDLAWLGLEWDGPVRRQSQHEPEYCAVLARLRGEGLLYPCFCSRAEILRELSDAGAAPHAAPDGSLLYPGTCRGLDPQARAERLASGAAHAWRLDSAAAMRRLGAPLVFADADAVASDRSQACDPSAYGDVVLARRDSATSYHLCSTHDDWQQGVTLILRGIDLRPAIGVHRLLQELSGWPAPWYAHHPLIVDEEGRRLSKRDGARTVRHLRQSGMSASEIRALAGRVSQWE